MTKSRTMLGYDSAEYSPLARSSGRPLLGRDGCTLITRDLREITADALDVRPSTPAPLSAPERNEVLAMFPNMNRLG